MCSEMYIPMREDTPEVILNPEKQIFSITGQSLPEDSHDFYEPILFWFLRYVQQPFDSMCLDIKLLYFNTASAKEIAKLLAALSECEQCDKITIRWFYDFHDTENLDYCKRYEVIPLRHEYYEFDYTTLFPEDEVEGTYHIIK
jgi:hypothetical protein